jgi:NAD+ diphosphatase
MTRRDNPNWFANNPLLRLNNEKDHRAFYDASLNDPQSLLVPLWRGDPLIAGGKAAFLSAAAREEFASDALVLMLGVKDGCAYFAIDASPGAEEPADAPFADIGLYMPIREAAGMISRDDLAIIGQARWLSEWHRSHSFCANCGAATDIIDGGAKRQCPACETEHFPRTDPVAIVLAVHDGACLLGRSPHFPPGFLSALAGFIEAAETPEEAARREIFEEAGVTLTHVRYQFSQPWPFPSSLMMGFIADAEDRALTLDTDEIEEAKWVDMGDIKALLNGEPRDDIFLPPKFTIARQLLERWVGGAF